MRPALVRGGVDHEDDPAVLLGLPGAHDEVSSTSRGPPVDRAHVVALDVVAEAVELRALTAGPDSSDRRAGGARRGGWAGDVSREGVQARTAPGTSNERWPAARPERPEDPHGHPVRHAVAAAGGHEAGREANPVRAGAPRVRARRRPHRPTAARRPGRHPGHRGRRCWSPTACSSSPRRAAPAPARCDRGAAPSAGSRGEVEDDEQEHDEGPPPHGRRLRPQRDRRQSREVDSTTVRQVIAISAGRAPTRVRCRARLSRRRPRARPRAGARGGEPGWRAPGLHVVRRHVRTTGQPRPGAARRHEGRRTAGGDPQGQRRGDPGGPGDVDDVGRHLVGDRHLTHCRHPGVDDRRRSPPGGCRPRAGHGGRTRRRAGARPAPRRTAAAAAARP